MRSQRERAGRITSVGQSSAAGLPTEKEDSAESVGTEKAEQIFNMVEESRNEFLITEAKDK